MTQSQSLDILKTGGNVFLTGEPGAGKTHVINQYIAWLEVAQVSVAVTASTGIAATHIGGMTIHAWSGIGIRDSLSARDLDQISQKEKIVKRLKKAKVLIIDEISMLDGSVLDMIETITRTIRGREEAFGGLQVVLVGDFFQLPPVTRQGDVMRYAFESRAWDSTQPLICYLTEQYRQEDELLLGLLKSIRKNEVEEEHFTLLQEQKEIGFEDIEPTKLYTHNADVDSVNSAKLGELRGKKVTFKMVGRGNKQLQEGLAKNCLSPEMLELKEEAMVMCTKNNFEAGYVNGTLARVISFDSDDGFPVIKTTEGVVIKMKPQSWEMVEDRKILAEVSQVPLRLAWAITVHKSQGMSLDAAEIDLTRAFVYGQGYVALSRVRTLEGLKILGMSANALNVDPKIVAHDAQFRTESDMAEDSFVQMDSEEIENMHLQFVTASGGKLPKGEVVVKKKGFERVKKESTYAETKKLLLEKKSVREISKERGVTSMTVWTHLEKLVDEESIKAVDLGHLKEDDAWEMTWLEIERGIKACGYDKLKPIFEYLEEKYDYESIRLARMLFILNKN